MLRRMAKSDACRNPRNALVLVCLFLIAATPSIDAYAAAPASGLAPIYGGSEGWFAPPPKSAWTLDVIPYGFLAWSTGTTTVLGRSADVHASPTQGLAHLEKIPFMGYVEARKGPLGIYGDVLFAEVGLTRYAVTSHQNATVSAAAGLDSTVVIGEVGGTFQLGEWASKRGTTAVDVLGGARYWYQNAGLKLDLTQTLDLRGLVIENNVAIAKSGNIDWVDPLVGGRIRHTLPNGHLIYLRGDVGGFHGGSQFTWNLAALYDFQLRVGKRATYSGVFGYRLLDVDYSQGEGPTLYEFDILMQGPVVGLDIAF